MAKDTHFEKLSSKVVYVYKKLISKFENKRNLSSKNLKKSYKKLIDVSIILLIIFSLVTLFLGFTEYSSGDYPIREKIRVGAICFDGWRSYSTGSGTCSHHGGVKEWIYKEIEVGMHYSDHEMFFNLFKVSALFLIIPSFFYRYYTLTFILYFLRTIKFFLYSVISFIWFPLLISMTVLYPIWVILSGLYSSIRNRK